MNLLLTAAIMTCLAIGGESVCSGTAITTPSSNSPSTTKTATCDVYKAMTSYKLCSNSICSQYGTVCNIFMLVPICVCPEYGNYNKSI